MAASRTRYLIAAKEIPGEPNYSQSAEDDIKGIIQGINMTAFITFDSVAEAIAASSPDYTGEYVGYSITITELTKEDLQ